MFFLFLFVVFAGTIAALWFHGFWSNVLTVINLIFSGMVAINYFEPAATFLEEQGMKEYTYLLDSLLFWLIFALTFGIVRQIMESLSATNVKFDTYVELGGRGVTALWGGWIMTCLVAMSLHISPVAPSPGGAFAEPKAGCFIGLAPDRQWLSLMQVVSTGSFAKINGTPNESFDPRSEYTIKYHQRRVELDKAEGLRVRR